MEDLLRMRGLPSVGLRGVMAVEHSEVLVEYRESKRVFKLKDKVTLCDDIANYLDGLGAKKTKVYMSENSTSTKETEFDTFTLQK